MSNGDVPAFPDPSCRTAGLTKREWFAGMALQGLLAEDGSSSGYPDAADMAIKQADAMLAQMAEMPVTVEGGR